MKIINLLLLSSSIAFSQSYQYDEKIKTYQCNHNPSSNQVTSIKLEVNHIKKYKLIFAGLDKKLVDEYAETRLIYNYANEYRDLYPQKLEIYKIDNTVSEFLVESRSNYDSTVITMYSACIEDKNPCSKAYFVYQEAGLYKESEKIYKCNLE